jgi:D(-)-tartrate dehydratase
MRWQIGNCLTSFSSQSSQLGGNESYPDLFQPYGGFPDGVEVEGGYIMMPELPGIGFEGKADLYREMTALSD